MMNMMHFQSSKAANVFHAVNVVFSSGMLYTGILFCQEKGAGRILYWTGGNLDMRRQWIGKWFCHKFAASLVEWQTYPYVALDSLNKTPFW